MSLLIVSPGTLATIMKILRGSCLVLSDVHVCESLSHNQLDCSCYNVFYFFVICTRFHRVIFQFINKEITFQALPLMFRSVWAIKWSVVWRNCEMCTFFTVFHTTWTSSWLATTSLLWRASLSKTVWFLWQRTMGHVYKERSKKLCTDLGRKKSTFRDAVWILVRKFEETGLAKLDVVVKKIRGLVKPY